MAEAVSCGKGGDYCIEDGQLQLYNNTIIEQAILNRFVYTFI